jgi:hypothetical protein
LLILYRCRLGESILKKYISEEEIRPLKPTLGFLFSRAETVQIERPVGRLELATIMGTSSDSRGEPWYSCRVHASEVCPQPLLELIHERALRQPCAQVGCAFYVGQLVQARRKDGLWALVRVVELVRKDHELQYKCAVVRDAVVFPV